ncbi:beta-ketoacyl synthase N-terminal-like domain-containing protein, partial [Enterococcus faecalis]|uniref:beta-ketoacyl synthase N-terminal-like domain-containing protein n=1 Tax=Enterococcus faecalis TaxID=1351 RepID=UPI003CC5DE25
CLAGEVYEFEPCDVLERIEQKRLDLFSQYGLVASLEAWEMSGLTEATIDPTRVLVILPSWFWGVSKLKNQNTGKDKK